MSTSQPQREPVNVIYCYSHKDRGLRDELAAHLAILEHLGLVKSWHDRVVKAGADWQHEINARLDSAQIILLLVSPDFMASDYCYGVEMKRSLERRQKGAARVIPVILRPVHWEISSLGGLQALPSDARPVTLWENRDAAFHDIAEGIRQVIEDAPAGKVREPALVGEVSPMTKPRRIGGRVKNLRVRRTVWVALIVCAVSAAIVYRLLAYKKSDAAVEYTGRVVDLNTQRAVQGAKVIIIEARGLPRVYYTDSEGVFHLEFPGAVNSARVQVEAAGYKAFDRNVSVSKTDVEDIRLTPADEPSGEIAKPAPTPSATPPTANSGAAIAPTVAGRRKPRGRPPGGNKNSDPYSALNYNAP